MTTDLLEQQLARERLTPEARAARAQELAQAVRELALLEEDHAAARAAMKQARAAAQQRVRALADVVRA